jgi:uncharacterized protein
LYATSVFIICLLSCLVTIHALAQRPLSAAYAAAQSGRVQASPQDIDAIQRAAQSGDAAAQLTLARAYENGTGVAKDIKKAAVWYRKAADNGNAEAENSLGVMYLLGEGVDQNKQLAVEWYVKASRQGNADAMFNLGAAYYNGDGVPTADDLSYAWFLLAKEAGNTKAADAVARAESQLLRWQITDGYKKAAQLCDDGVYAPANQTAAASWWLKAATRGDNEARVALAQAFLNGRGVTQDFSRARYWCNESARHGEATGQYCLGYIYQRGLGVPASPKNAKRWYEAAAAQGNIASIRAVAQIDETGEGGKPDLVEAAAWYAKLAAANDRDALQHVTRLKSEMTPQQWKAVQKRLPGFSVDAKKLEALLQSTTP